MSVVEKEVKAKNEQVDVQAVIDEMAAKGKKALNEFMSLDQEQVDEVV